MRPALRAPASRPVVIGAFLSYFGRPGRPSPPPPLPRGVPPSPSPRCRSLRSASSAPGRARKRPRARRIMWLLNALVGGRGRGAFSPPACAGSASAPCWALACSPGGCVSFGFGLRDCGAWPFRAPPLPPLPPSRSCLAAGPRPPLWRRGPHSGPPGGRNNAASAFRPRRLSVLGTAPPTMPPRSRREGAKRNDCSNKL